MEFIKNVFAASKSPILNKSISLKMLPFDKLNFGFITFVFLSNSMAFGAYMMVKGFYAVFEALSGYAPNILKHLKRLKSISYFITQFCIVQKCIR